MNEETIIVSCFMFQEGFGALEESHAESTTANTACNDEIVLSESQIPGNPDGASITFENNVNAITSPPSPSALPHAANSTTVATEVDDEEVEKKTLRAKVESEINDRVAASRNWVTDLASKTLEPAKGFLNAAGELLKGEEEKAFDPIVLLAASREVTLSISKIFHEVIMTSFPLKFTVLN